MLFLTIFLGDRLYFEGVGGVPATGVPLWPQVSYIQVPATGETWIQQHMYICLYICVCTYMYVCAIHVCLCACAYWEQLEPNCAGWSWSIELQQHHLSDCQIWCDTPKINIISCVTFCERANEQFMLFMLYDFYKV